MPQLGCSLLRGWERRGRLWAYIEARRKVAYCLVMQPTGCLCARGWPPPGMVRALRQRLGLTQTQLAGRLGADQASLSRWETGAASPREPARGILASLAAQAGFEPPPEPVQGSLFTDPDTQERSPGRDTHGMMAGYPRPAAKYAPAGQPYHRVARARGRLR